MIPRAVDCLAGLGEEGDGRGGAVVCTTVEHGVGNLGAACVTHRDP